MFSKQKFPRLVDWYILTEVSLPFLGGVGFFTFILLMFQLLRLAEFFIIHGIPLLDLLEVSGLMCTTFIPFSLPISFLISLLLGFGRLSSDSELIALKASGISLFRLAVAPALLGVSITFLSLILNLDLVPRAERALKEKLVRIGSSRIVSSINEGSFNQGFFDLIIYADKVDSQSNKMRKVFIYDEREPKSPLTIVAKQGQWTLRSQKNGGSAAVLELQDGNIHRSDTNEGTYQKIDFGEYRLFLKNEASTSGGWSKPKMVAFNALRVLMKESVGNPKSYQLWSGEFWRRISIALAPLSFMLLGIGSGIQPTRSVKSGASLIAFTVLVLYYGLIGYGSSLNESGKLAAPLAMQLGNLVIFLWGLFVFRRASN